MPLTLQAIAELVHGQLEGDAALSIEGVAGLADARTGDLSFFASAKYKAQLAETQASAVLAPDGVAMPKGLSVVRVGQPHLAFARVSQALHPVRPPAPGIDAKASVHASAVVHPSAHVGPFAVVEANATIGPRATVSAFAFVGQGARIGDDTRLAPHSAVLERCVVGARCFLQVGAVVGSDGFGFALDAAKPEHVKIPQTGIARLEDDVELGAQSCVDRATTGETVVGHGTKIDNLVQVAHNVRIGPLSIVCAQVGISGSATVGQGVVLAGQVGVAGHLHVGDLARIGAQAGVAQDVEPGETLLGAPAIEHRQYLKAARTFASLPELAKQVRALQKRLEALESKESEP